MFDWMEPPPLPRHPERTLATVHDEIRARARLLRGLGYPRPRIEARITANLTWEHELIGRPRALSDVPGLVAEVCARGAHEDRGGGSPAPTPRGGTGTDGKPPARGASPRSARTRLSRASGSSRRGRAPS